MGVCLAVPQASSSGLFAHMYMVNFADVYISLCTSMRVFLGLDPSVAQTTFSATSCYLSSSLSAPLCNVKIH